MNSILHYDISAIVVLLVILISMLFRKVISNHSTRIFYSLIILSLASTAFDILSECHSFPYYIRYASLYLYYFSSLSLLVNYVLYIISVIGIWFRLKNNLFRKIAIFFPYWLSLGMLCINPFCHYFFMINQDGNYQRGPLIFCFGIITTYYMLAGLFSLLRWRKTMEVSKFVVLMCLFPITVSVLIFQTFITDYYLICFSNAIMLIFLQFFVQRSGENLDVNISVQSYTAAVNNLHTIYKVRRNESVVLFKILNEQLLRRYLGIDDYYLLLRTIANDVTRIIKTERREVDFCYLHDSTFGIFSEDMDMDQMRLFANEIEAEVNRDFTVKKMDVNVSSKVCVVRLPSDFDSVSAFLTFVGNFFTKMPEEQNVAILSEIAGTKDFKMKNELDSIISRAISEKNFQLYYQPIYSIKEKKFVSSEALLRLIDVKYGFVSPALFIPAAEKNGAIHQIGDFVLDEVCRFMGTKEVQEFGVEYIEVNLSTAQCIEPDLVSKISGFLAKHNLSTKQINLEITETAADFDPSVVDKNVKQLAQLGISFSLDDYGTGYSNIKRVTTLPLSIVKLDKSFVDEMHDKMMWTVIVNTITMLKQMNKIILVEGVEDEETVKAFEKLGCDYIQGYYFSKPLPEKEYIEFLKKNNRKPKNA